LRVVAHLLTDVYMYFFTGIQDVVKQISAHRNGTVRIITVYLKEDGRIVKNYFSECQLYNQDTRYV